MNFLIALGVNSTIFYLFGIYLVGFLTLYFLIYKPYYGAFVVRKTRTVGGEETANALSQTLGVLQVSLNEKVRTQREKVQDIFDQHLKSGQQQSAKILTEIRAEIDGQKKQYIEKVSAELAKQKRGIKDEVLHLKKLVHDKMEMGS